MVTTGWRPTVIVAYDSPLEPMTLAATLGPERPAGALSGCWSDAHFAGRDPGPRPTPALRGTSLQRLVRDELLTFPAGRTPTNGEPAPTLQARTGRRDSGHLPHRGRHG